VELRLAGPPSGSLRQMVRPELLPVFLMFFFWGFGTGGLWLVRPLFAFETGGTFLLVALNSSVSAMPRIVTGPITGYLTDRFGRKPFVLLGSILHIVAMVGDFYIDTYIPFLLLEILGGVGISVWMTSASVLMADSTRVETRGRVVAVREMSSRMGLLAGPVVAGTIGATFGLRYIFLFIAACKVAVIIVTVLWIKETRKRDPDKARGWQGFHRPKIDISMFRTRAFLALAIGTVAASMVGQGTGAFRTLFPPQTKQVAGLDEAQIGFLLAIAVGLSIAAALPAGVVIDRYGRKVPLLGGLLMTALAAYIMAIMGSFQLAAFAVIIFGLSEAFGTGTLQVYAMDLAPEDKRGAFLGVWGLFMNIGQIVGPLVVGILADVYGFAFAFYFIAGLLVAGSAMVALFGRETRHAATPPI
jgi:DHA1 family multidrug resistance protein-like MFS transporter